MRWESMSTRFYLWFGFLTKCWITMARTMNRLVLWNHFLLSFMSVAEQCLAEQYSASFTFGVCVECRRFSGETDAVSMGNAKARMSFCYGRTRVSEILTVQTLVPTRHNEGTWCETVLNERARGERVTFSIYNSHATDKRDGAEPRAHGTPCRL